VGKAGDDAAEVTRIGVEIAAEPCAEPCAELLDLGQVSPGERAPF
jgi:hypothetical protein